MESVRDLAIVLRVVPYEERHRIVTAITEKHGKITAMARNAVQSRRFGGTLEPFAASEWRFVERPGAELYRIEEATIRRAFEGLRKNFDRLALASAFNELLLKLTPERQPAPDLFKLHANALATLDEAQTTDRRFHLVLLNSYIAKALQLHGTQPLIASCGSCQRSLLELDADQELACSIAQAAWLCPDCSRSGGRHLEHGEAQGTSFQNLQFRIRSRAFIDFLAAMNLPIRQAPEILEAPEQDHEVLLRFLDGVLTYHVPGFDRTRLKALSFLLPPG